MSVIGMVFFIALSILGILSVGFCLYVGFIVLRSWL